MRVLNLTQHFSTTEQKNAGVIEPQQDVKEEIKSLLTFSAPPHAEEMYERAEKLARISVRHDVEYAMIGGAPYFMTVLEKVLAQHGVVGLYSFTRRETVERVVGDEVVKTSIFKHVDWVYPAY